MVQKCVPIPKQHCSDVQGDKSKSKYSKTAAKTRRVFSKQ